jgi:hypothetical protein
MLNVEAATSDGNDFLKLEGVLGMRPRNQSDNDSSDEIFKNSGKNLLNNHDAGVF